MKLPAIGLRVALCTMAMALSGVAQAACYIGPETNASSVQEDSGNGTYNCSVVSTSNGSFDDVTSLVNWEFVDGRVTWSVPVNENGYPSVDVDLVSVNRSSGKRCNYTYAEQKAGGSGLSTSDLGGATSVTFCADGVIAAEPPPEPPQPISTVGNQCTVTFDYNNTVGNTFDVAIGYSKQQVEGGLYEGAAICANTGGDVTKQKQCINECVPRPIAEGTICEADKDGRLPLECAPCIYDQPEPNTGLPYCWVYENRVNEVPGYFKPSPKKKSLSANIDVSTGSNCYTVTVGPMYGGRTYSYWYCPQ
jgi:hypothetical protein